MLSAVRSFHTLNFPPTWSCSELLSKKKNNNKNRRTGFVSFFTQCKSNGSVNGAHGGCFQTNSLNTISAFASLFIQVIMRTTGGPFSFPNCKKWRARESTDYKAICKCSLPIRLVVKVIHSRQVAVYKLAWMRALTFSRTESERLLIESEAKKGKFGQCWAQRCSFG